MRIGELAERLGTTAHAIRFYERRGLVPATRRTESGYREYSDRDVSRMRLLIGLRSLDLPLDQAAELAGLCAEGKCDRVSETNELRGVNIRVSAPRRRRRRRTLLIPDHRPRPFSAGELESGKSPRPLITMGKEDARAS